MGSKRSLELDRSPLVALGSRTIPWALRSRIHSGASFAIPPGLLGPNREPQSAPTGTEGTGQSGTANEARGLSEWVRAVNRHGGFGAWGADVSRNPTDIHDTLQRHGSVMDT